MKRIGFSSVLLIKKYILLIMLLAWINSCQLIWPHATNEKFSLTPVNFKALNSKYDDYNLNSEKYTFEFDLVFSTNRFSEGEDFDFIYFSIEPGFYYEYEINYQDPFINVYERYDIPLIESINSNANELAPYFTEQQFTEGTENQRFFYTSDQNGNLDIFCEYYKYDSAELIPFGDPIFMSELNTIADEGYFTLHSDESNSSEIAYFTSNREGSFDIFQAIGESNILIDESDSVDINYIETLSSDADDKCPFIMDNMMVFVSDRRRGSGGFDLYYSTYDGLTWSKPKNFGKEINSEYNEYRPVIIKSDRGIYSNDLMIFSSDRPGGMGGYDLYYVGLKSRSYYFN